MLYRVDSPKEFSPGKLHEVLVTGGITLKGPDNSKTIIPRTGGHRCQICEASVLDGILFVVAVIM